MKIHFIGIGGIGVSALAQYYLAKNHQISGSDLVSSKVTEMLEKKGIKIIIGNSSNNIERGLDLVIYSPAVRVGNPEYDKARELGIKTQSYPEALGDLTKEYYTIAVSGAHGKSTTTSMIALTLIEAGFDPTVIVGTKLKEFGDSNFRSGNSKYLVIEACEYDSSFLSYSPKIIVVTNIDREHLDYFKTFSNVKKAFKEFIMRLPDDGFLIFNKDDKYKPKILKPKFRILGCSLKQRESVKIKKIMNIPGKHNVSNALAAFQVAKILSIREGVILKALSKFKGTWRRFEVNDIVIDAKKITLISDYAHHPNEIVATLKAAREKYKNKKIWCIFQPHQHQRTYYLFNDFVKIFRKAPVDNLIITDIYDVAGRETKNINKEVSSEKLVKKIKNRNVIYVPMQDIDSFIRKNILTDNVLIIMGAGSIYKVADSLK